MSTIQTILAGDIESENLDIRYDMSVKRVLGNIPLLAPHHQIHSQGVRKLFYSYD